MEKNKVIIERIFDAPRQKVWAAWTTEEGIKKWWGPAGFTAPTAQIDFKEGGKYLLCMHGSPAPGMPAGDFWSTGTYKQIVPLEKIVCTDSFSDKDGHLVSASQYGMEGVPLELEVIIEFQDAPDGKTKMTLTHIGMPAGQHADDMTQGWNQSFDKLNSSLKG